MLPPAPPPRLHSPPSHLPHFTCTSSSQLFLRLHPLLHVASHLILKPSGSLSSGDKKKKIDDRLQYEETV